MSNAVWRNKLMTPKVKEALVREFFRARDDGESITDSLVVARWFSLDGIEYFGLEMNPNRPSVVYGCVRLPEGWGGGWEFSTFWVIRELGNPLSEGEALEDQTIPIRVNDFVVNAPRWELDLYWEPIGLKELTARIEGQEAA